MPPPTTMLSLAVPMLPVPQWWEILQIPRHDVEMNLRQTAYEVWQCRGPQEMER
jgi:hypothetical protein